MFDTIYMHQLIGWLSERGGGGNFLNLLQKEEGIQKGGGIPSEKGGGGVPTLEETMFYFQSQK